MLAKFDDGSPALTQIPVGQGNLLVLTSGWNPADSQFAVSSKFPPLMQTLLDWSSAAASSRFQFTTGMRFLRPLFPLAMFNGKSRMEKRKRSQRPSRSPQPISQNLCGNLRLEGRRFAVNLPLDESRTAPMSPDELARLGVPLQTPAEFPVVPAAERQRHLQQAELENRQKFWRWLIVGALAVTLVEIVLSGWLARRVKTVEATT